MASTSTSSELGRSRANRRRGGRRSCAGFTLAEALVASAIGAFILAGTLTSYILCARNFRALANYWELHADGRYAIDRFAADMRGVSAVTSFATNGPLVVRIPVAFSGTGLSTSNKTVTYTYTGGALRRTDSSTGATSTLATNVYQLSLALYDKVGNSTTVLSNAKGVRIELFLRKTLARQQQTEDYLSARLTMRNIP